MDTDVLDLDSLLESAEKSIVQAEKEVERRKEKEARIHELLKKLTKVGLMISRATKVVSVDTNITSTITKLTTAEKAIKDELASYGIEEIDYPAPAELTGTDAVKNEPEPEEPTREERFKEAAAKAAERHAPVLQRLADEPKPEPTPKPVPTHPIITAYQGMDVTDVEWAFDGLLRKLNEVEDDYNARQIDPAGLRSHIGAITCRCRILQFLFKHPIVDDLSNQLMRALTRVSGEYRPGFIHEMRRDYGGSVTELANACAEFERELDNVSNARQRKLELAQSAHKALEEFDSAFSRLTREEALTNGNRKGLEKLLRKAVTGLGPGDPRVIERVELLPELRENDSIIGSVKLANMEEEAVDLEAEDVVEKGDWDGRTVLLFGGTPREERRLELEKKFGITLEWPDAGTGRAPKQNIVQRAIESAGRGAYGAVFVITRLCSHQAWYDLRDAAGEAKTPFAPLRGYGVGQFRIALKGAFEK